jgi:hypothetical protein
MRLWRLRGVPVSIQQLALAAAAVAVMFWPQIQAQLANLRQGAVPRTAPTSGGGRSQWVPTVLALQDELTAAGQAKAAAMAGQLVVEIISGPTPTTGAKK